MATAFPKPRFGETHAADCSALYLRDLTGMDCECPVANYERREAVCRNLVVLDGAGNVISSGGVAQKSCLQLSGDPVVGDIFTIVLNNCSFTYTVKASDLASNTEVRACATFRFDVSGTPTLPCTADVTLTIGGLVIPFTLAYNASPFVLAQNAKTAIDAWLLLQSYNTYVSVTLNGSSLIICISPSWYNSQFGANINNIIGTIVFSGCNLTAQPAGFQFSGGVPASTTPEEQTRQNVLQGIYNTLVGREPIGTDDCGEPVYACPLPLTFSLSLCSPLCPLSIEGLYPGEPFTVQISQTLQPSSTANLSSTLAVVPVCNMKAATSPDTDKDVMIIPVGSDDIYCGRFTIVWRKPAYYYRCFDFQGIGTGVVIEVVIDHNGDTSLSYTFTTVSSSATTNAETFVVNYRMLLEGLGVDPYDVYVERNGTRVCIYLRNDLYSDTSSTTISATQDGQNILVGILSGSAFSLLLPEVNQTDLYVRCFANLCRMECCLIEAILAEVGNCECPDNGCLPISAQIDARINAIRFLLCQGDICGAKRLIREWNVFGKKGGCGCAKS